MTTAEERMKILDMIRDGVIKPEEGARLLQALQTGTKKGAENAREPRWLRVRITDLTTNRVKVNVTLPMGLVKVGIKLGARFVTTGDVNLTEVNEAIKNGTIGKIFEFEDRDEGERTEIWLD